MVRVKNTHTAMVILRMASQGKSRITITAGGETAISEDDWAELLLHPAVKGRVSAGSLEVVTIAKFAADPVDEERQQTPKPKAKAKVKAKAKAKAAAKD